MKKIGGRVVAMLGDPGQLSPAIANNLWTGTCTEDYLAGQILHACFTTDMKLTVTQRLETTDADVVIFDTFLDKLRGG